MTQSIDCLFFMFFCIFFRLLDGDGINTILRDFLKLTDRLIWNLFWSFSNGFNHLQTFILLESLIGCRIFFLIKLSKNTFDRNNFASISFRKIERIKRFFSWWIEIPTIERQRNIKMGMTTLRIIFSKSGFLMIGFVNLK